LNENEIVVAQAKMNCLVNLVRLRHQRSRKSEQDYKNKTSNNGTTSKKRTTSTGQMAGSQHNSLLIGYTLKIHERSLPQNVTLVMAQCREKYSGHRIP
jgi:hypothetical protein